MQVDRTTPQGEAVFIATQLHREMSAAVLREPARTQANLASLIEQSILKFMPAQKGVLAVLEHGPMAPCRIAKLLGRKSVRPTLHRMAERGLIKRTGRGVWEKVQ